MTGRWITVSAAAALSTLYLSAAPLAAEQPAEFKGEPVDMAGVIGRAGHLTQPSEAHELLRRFLGDWNTEFVMTMPGAKIPPGKGEATFDWLMEGRWIKMESSGTQMGMPVRSFMILGYDNFKMSYVTVAVTSMDTAMATSEGDMDPGGTALITYGTLDEYLTGEHDKMVKYVWRFHSADEIRLEIHDLPIGEKNTQVARIEFTRKPQEGP